MLKMIKCRVTSTSHGDSHLHLNCLAVRIFPQFPSQLISQTAEAGEGGGAVLSGVRTALNTGRMWSSCSGHEARPVTSCLCASNSFLQMNFNGSWGRHGSLLCFIFPQHIWEEKPHMHVSAALLTAQGGSLRLGEVCAGTEMWQQPAGTANFRSKESGLV